MGWTKGKRRAEVDATPFIHALCQEHSAAKLARLAGVHSRTVRRWRDGQQWARVTPLMRLVDGLFPGVWSRQPRLADDEIGPDTWVAGVGMYTRRISRGRS